MKQKKNHDMRNWFLGTVIAGGIILGLAKNVSNNAPKKPRLKYKVKQGDYFEKIEFNEDLVHGSLIIMNPDVKPEKLQIGQEIITGYLGNSDFAKQRNLFQNDSDNFFLARMLFGEARNCSEFEKAQIAYSAINKISDGVNWNGTTLRQVLNCETFSQKSKKRRSVYDCFNQKDNNWLAVNNPEKHNKNAWKECLRVAEDTLAKRYKDETKNATLYFNPKIANPYWRSHKNTIHVPIKGCKHKFYRER